MIPPRRLRGLEVLACLGLRPPKTAQEASKAPIQPTRPPRWPQLGSRGPQDRPRGSQEGPRALPKGTKMAKKVHQDGLRRRQMGLKPQNGPGSPKTPPRGPRGAPRGSKEAPSEPLRCLSQDDARGPGGARPREHGKTSQTTDEQSNTRTPCRHSGGSEKLRGVAPSAVYRGNEKETGRMTAGEERGGAAEE